MAPVTASQPDDHLLRYYIVEICIIDSQTGKWVSRGDCHGYMYMYASRVDSDSENRHTVQTLTATAPTQHISREKQHHETFVMISHTISPCLTSTHIEVLRSEHLSE
jgi:hypothetical protein